MHLLCTTYVPNTFNVRSSKMFWSKFVQFVILEVMVHFLPQHYVEVAHVKVVWGLKPH